MHESKTNGRSRSVRLIALAAAIGLAGCQASESEADATAAADGSPETASAVQEQSAEEHAAAMEVGYTCADDETFTISFAGPDQIHLTLDGETRILNRTAGHTGMLFSDDDVVFFSRGREASVEMGGEPVRTDCVAQGHPE